MADLTLDRVSKVFPDGTEAVRDVSLTVPSGTRAALIGASGSGKTTVLRMINKLILPTSGSIALGGEDVTGLPGAELRRRIGYVVQGIGLFPHMTVAQNVGITPRLLGWPADRIEARVEELLTLVHLTPDTYRDRLPAALSGGQQQRVGFARALAAEPSVILLDEAFGALDPVTRSELQNEFCEIQESLGVTAVLVTHDMAEALFLADRLFVMHRGRLIRSGTPAELWQDPGDERVAAMIHQPKMQAAKLRALDKGAA